MSYSQRTLLKLATLKKDIKEVWNAYIDIEEDDSKEDVKEKVENVVSASLSYFIHDYWMAIAFGALMVALNALHLHFGWIFLAGWVFDIGCALYFVVLDHMTGNDCTLGSNTRRSLDVLKRKNNLAWLVALFGIMSKASVWDGPERVVMIFRKEIHNWLRVGMAISLLAAFQAAFWQALWTWGYETADGDVSPIYMIIAMGIWYVLAVKRYFSRSGWQNSPTNE